MIIICRQRMMPEVHVHTCRTENQYPKLRHNCKQSKLLGCISLNKSDLKIAIILVSRTIHRLFALILRTQFKPQLALAQPSGAPMHRSKH